MKSEIKFTKMNGLGNDFIICNKSDLLNIKDFSKLARYVSHRNTGIGCDQFIVYETSINKTLMEIYNSDGSKAEACGNATRCIAYLNFLSTAEKINFIQVFDKKLKCEIFDENNISVNMGSVEFEEGEILDKITNFLKDYLFENSEILIVNIGNPHLVIFDSKLSFDDMKMLGPKIEKNSIFSNGINVNFAKLNNNIINLKVWERGTGFTFACGSGASATFAAAKKLGYITDSAIVKFELGNLKMEFDNNDIIMKGPVKLVAEGKFCYDE